jgi:hypothetical protein
MWRNLFLFPARKMIFLFPREKARGNQTKRFVFSDFIRKFAGFFAGRSREAFNQFIQNSLHHGRIFTA